MTAEQLRRQLAELYNAGRFKELMAATDQHWPAAVGDSVDRHSAEVCRLQMLACFAEERWAQAELWKTRALRHAAQSGWWNGLALIIISQVFGIASKVDVEDRERYELCSAALDEMVPLIDRAVDDPFVDATRLRSLYWEKKGYLRYGTGDFAEAVEAYERAASYVENDDRRHLKVRGARALCWYMSDPTGPAGADAITETQAVLGGAEGRFDFIASIARHNLAVMTGGGGDLRPYEIL